MRLPSSTLRPTVWCGQERAIFGGQHDPRMLEDGRILFFDNNGRKESSGVFEYDLKAKKNSWRYIGTDEHPFYSKFCGTADRLPNGNTLITESDNGRAFELTRDKEIVWEFHNPARAGDDNEFIAALFEVERLSEDLDFVDPDYVALASFRIRSTIEKKAAATIRVEVLVEANLCEDGINICSGDLGLSLTRENNS